MNLIKINHKCNKLPTIKVIKFNFNHKSNNLAQHKCNKC